MRILILGASGNVGRHLGQFAAEARHDVTVLVRPTTRYAPPAVEGVKVNVVHGDVLEPGAIDRCIAQMNGCDAVLSSLGIMRRSAANPWSELTSPPDFCSRTATLIVEAMKAHGVPRVIAVSSGGVGDSYARMTGFMKFMVQQSNVGVGYRDLEKMERVYELSGLDWLCVRPTRLTNGPRTDRVKLTDAFTLTAAISRADVASWMLQQLSSPSPSSSRTPQITGA
jgi:putative NADH-flavin reductase